MKRVLKFMMLVCVGGILILICIGVYWNQRVVAEFSGNKWQVPTKVYAKPLELFAGAGLTKQRIQQELELLRYESIDAHSIQKEALPMGAYSMLSSQNMMLQTRGFDFWDGVEASQALLLRFQKDQLMDIQKNNRSVGIARLEPALIGGIFSGTKQSDHNEDRILIELNKVPPLLIHGLLLVEDQHFYQHQGVSLKSVLRAVATNVSSGELLQGGSTITQQLVKNFFLTQERTLSRKVQEAVVSLLLERHFSKDEILEGYLNEVYLGQDGARAIHGFGLASFHYFGKPVSDLWTEEMALLIAMIKGPSYYHPQRNSERALQRRNLVLNILYENRLLTEEAYQSAKSRPLSVLKNHHYSPNRYPAFLDLIRRQLKDDYPEAVLASEGLRVFSTLDPSVQMQSEVAVRTTVKGLGEGLESAAIITEGQTGEVLALVGGLDSKGGFNRALDAVRPIGSIVKPIVYLAALEERYPLNYGLEDAPIEIPAANGVIWSPENFTRISHGSVLLQTALVHSYNQASVHLGMMVGLEKTLEMLSLLGLNREVLAVPAVLLGSVDLSPIEVAVLYQTIAANGFNVPLRSIQAVQKSDGTVANRYPLKVTQRVSPESIMLLKHLLQQVVSQGTGRGLQETFGRNAGLAGKTGTTNELRDSWFVGMGEPYLGVVWVGYDDNQPTTLTGASGALKVWAAMMQGLKPKPLNNPILSGYETVWLNQTNGLRSSQGCSNAIEVILLSDSIPEEFDQCAEHRLDSSRGVKKKPFRFRWRF